MRPALDRVDCCRRLAELDASGATDQAAALCEALPCNQIIECQRYLGWFYGSQSDFQKSCGWYLKAVKQGSAEALEECWQCVLLSDAAGDKDLAISLCATEPLAENVKFQRYLVREYFSRGDSAELLRWSRKVAEFGDPSDLLYVADLYLSRGEPLHALHYLEHAANSGSARAHQLLGEIYAFGLGVQPNESEASLHYQVSAREGYLLSKTRLLHMKRIRSGFFKKCFYTTLIVACIIEALFLRVFSPRDKRLADLPQDRKQRSPGVE